MATSKQALRINISDDLRSWLDAQAEDLGCDAATWVRMLVTAARKQGAVALDVPQVPTRLPTKVPTRLPSSVAQVPGQVPGQAPAPPTRPAYALDVPEVGPEAESEVDDSWRGPVDDDIGPTALDALIADKLASTALSPAPGPPVEVFAPRPPGAPGLSTGGVRAIRAPPPRFAPASGPAHLRAL